jgi:hypothetical protein
VASPPQLGVNPTQASVTNASAPLSDFLATPIPATPTQVQSPQAAKVFFAAHRDKPLPFIPTIDQPHNSVSAVGLNNSWDEKPLPRSPRLHHAENQQSNLTLYNTEIQLSDCRSHGTETLLSDTTLHDTETLLLSTFNVNDNRSQDIELFILPELIFQPFSCTFTV